MNKYLSSLVILYYVVLNCITFLLGWYAAETFMDSFLSIYVECDFAFSMFMRLLFIYLSEMMMKKLTLSLRSNSGSSE